MVYSLRGDHPILWIVITMSLRIEFLERWGEIVSARRDALSEDLSVSAPYRTEAWLWACSKFYDGWAKPLAPTVIRDRLPLSPFPLVITRDFMSWIPWKVLSVAMGRVSCQVDWPLSREYWGEAADHVVEALMRTPWHRFEVRSLAHEGFILEALVPRLQKRVPTRLVTAEKPDFVVCLPSHPEIYNGSLSRNLRRDMHKQSHRLARMGGHLCFHPAGLAVGRYDELADLHCRTLTGLGRLSYLHDARYRTFFRDLLARPPYGLYEIRLADRLLVGGIMADIGDRRWALVAALDRELDKRLSPQTLCMYLLIHDAMRSGKRALDLGAGSGDYKMRLGAISTGGTTLMVFRNETVRRLHDLEGRIRHAASRGVQTLRRRLGGR